MIRLLLGTIGFVLISFSASAQEEADFEGLGDLPGGDFESEATSVSADGSVVVGQSDSGNGLAEAFRWMDGEMEGLGELPGGQVGSWARDVSANGSVVVGVSNSNNGNEAFWWEGGVMQGLGELPGGGVSSNGFGVSGDGAVAVGASSGENGLEGFRWEDGEMEALGTLPGGNDGSWAYGISSDGQFIVGFSGSELGSEAFRWHDGEMEGLGDLPGGNDGSTANAVSADGSVVVGRSPSENSPFPSQEAFRWEDGEMVGLGDLEGGSVNSEARDVSADGSVVIGAGNVTQSSSEAFIWTEEEGIRGLKEVLESDYDLDLTGWTLESAEGISDDGFVIVGFGENPDGDTEAWRASLPTGTGETVRYVDGATGSDTSDCTDELNPCATIAHAVGQAMADDAIEITDGEYTESIEIDKSLTLNGESTTGTIIQAHENPGEATERVVTIEGDVEVEITDVTIRHGVAIGTAPDGLGGGLYVNGATLNLTEAVVRDNSADQNGGGMRVDDGGSFTLANVLFKNNTANSGGAVFNNSDSSTLTNVVFSENTAGATGGAMFNSFTTSSPTLTNVTFHGNVADLLGGGMYNTESSPTLTNTIVWGNSAGFNANEIYNSSNASIELHYSLYSNGEDDIEEGGGFEVENSLTDDPLFVDPESGDLHLEDVSPAIDAGDPGTDPDLFPTDEDGDPIDLDGNPRIFNEGIDIGAYENQGIVTDDASPEEIAEILSAPTPNPAGGVTTFTVAVERGQYVTVELFDVLGRRVETLYNEVLAGGMSETLALDASILPAGTYLIRATGEDFNRVRQMTVMK